VSGVRVAPPVQKAAVMRLFCLYLCAKFNLMIVDLFIPCFIDQFYPATAFNVIKVLQKAGVEVRYNPEQTCCGQPAFNSGHWSEARKLAGKFLDDFSDAKIIVGPSASCTAYIRNYYSRLFEGNPELMERYNILRSNIFEFSDFLVNVVKVTSISSCFSHKVTYHDACSALREYGLTREPRILLNEVKGIELIEMEDTETCCGFGGTFATKFKHISTAMTAQKVEKAMATGVEYIVSSEASCLMNMESYIRKQKLPIKTIHLADVLAQNICN
jgi:L-lactate dehydrogenase complex protein LldE